MNSFSIRAMATMVVLLIGFGLVAWFNDSPGSSRASNNPWEGYTLYGINATNGS
jgi:hypothetical protein